jgi:hypothetical protein
VYGKIFMSMYDGSLRTKSPWQALVTFQQMIVLANKHGEVDMTAEALSFRTGIPLEIIKLGIDALEQPDPDSRSSEEEGRRIVRVNPNRVWGWRIVNYKAYREMRSAEERREYMKNHMREKRAAARNGEATKKALARVSNVSNVSQSSKQYAGSSKHTTKTTADDGASPSSAPPMAAPKRKSRSVDGDEIARFVSSHDLDDLVADFIRPQESPALVISVLKQHLTGKRKGAPQATPDDIAMAVEEYRGKHGETFSTKMFDTFVANVRDRAAEAAATAAAKAAAAARVEEERAHRAAANAQREQEDREARERDQRVKRFPTEHPERYAELAAQAETEEIEPDPGRRIRITGRLYQKVLDECAAD